MEAIFDRGAANAGRTHERNIVDFICNKAGGTLPDNMWFQAQIDPSGEPVDDGFKCNPEGRRGLSKTRKGNSRPDFILSEVSPRSVRSGNRAILIGDMKLSGNSLYNQYVLKYTRKQNQLKAILNFARNKTYTDSAVFICAYPGDVKKFRTFKKKVRAEGLRNGTMVWIFSPGKLKK